MKKFSLALVALATALAISPLALAQLTLVSDPPDSQEWNETGVGNFTTIDMFVETPGTTFNATGNYPESSLWTSTSVNPTFYTFTGSALNDLNFYTSVTATSLPYTFDFYALNGTSVVDSAIVTGGSGVWSIGSLPASKLAGENTTPVPDGGMTLTLLGLAVAGLAGLRRKLSM